jgi:hypothetical protein
MATSGPARAEAPRTHDHDHSHGLVHDSIKRSHDGIRAVLLALGVLGLTAIAQAVVFSLSGSVALLADLIHSFGDALTAIPLGIAFLLRSERAERNAGLFVVTAISSPPSSPESKRSDVSSTRHRWTTSGRSPPPAPSATPATSSPRRSAPASAWTARR